MLLHKGIEPGVEVGWCQPLNGAAFRQHLENVVGTIRIARTKIWADQPGWNRPFGE